MIYQCSAVELLLIPKRVLLFQVLLVHEKGTQPSKAVQSRDGITPPFHNPKERVFRKMPDINSAAVRRTEDGILDIAAVGNPPLPGCFVSYFHGCAFNFARSVLAF